MIARCLYRLTSDVYLMTEADMRSRNILGACKRLSRLNLAIAPIVTGAIVRYLRVEMPLFALFTNPPLAGAASLSFQYWVPECNCWFFFKY